MLKVSEYGTPLFCIDDYTTYLSFEKINIVIDYYDLADLGMKGTPEFLIGTEHVTFLVNFYGVFFFMLPKYYVVYLN
jgi:hypothetical protein